MMYGIAWPKTPLGPLWVEVDGDALVRLHWGVMPVTVKEVNHPAKAALDAYFERGEPLPASVLKLCKPAGGTAFQQRVWAALLDIRHGTTETYGALAARLGTHARAIGGAVGANPLPVFVPCHRVMGAKGALTGFSAPGGVATKVALLKREGVNL